MEVRQAGRKATADYLLRYIVAALFDPLGHTGNCFLSAGQLQKNQFDPVTSCLPLLDQAKVSLTNNAA